MKRKFNLNQLKKIHKLSKHNLMCIKGGTGSKKGGGYPPIMDRIGF